MNTSKNGRRRRGNVLLLTLFLLVGLFAILALSVDVGYVLVSQTQLQRTADSAAIAACWELVDEDVVADDQVRTVARQFAGLNPVLSDAPNLADDDVVTGYITNPSDPASPFQTGTGNQPNAVWVRVRRNADQNGEVPLFFAKVLGYDQMAMEAEATAALLTDIKGFRAPSAGKKNGILPFALDEQTWNAMLAGGGADNWTWDPVDQEIEAGGDGIREVNLYPQGTGAPGNRGTVDIGSNNNSTADIARQILQGPSADDFSYHGGKIELDASGVLMLNGDTGISAGVKDELASIKGEPRCIPIYREVSGPGNNAMYTIVGWVGIRILDVKLTGQMSSKRVIVQPACYVGYGAISSEGAGSSQYVYSPVWLAR